MTGEANKFQSPKDPTRWYEIKNPNDPVDPSGYDQVIFGSRAEGIDIVSGASLAIDALRRRPRYNAPSFPKLIDDANARWSLEDVRAKQIFEGQDG